MRVRLLLVAIGLCILTACSPNAATQTPPDPVGAYQLMVKWLFQQDPGLNQAPIFAIDAASTGLDDPAQLVTALKADPLYAQYDIRSATRAELEQEGIIHPNELWFEGGFLMEFTNPSFSSNQITVDAQKWVGGTGAIYASMTAVYANGGWVLDHPTITAIA